MIGSRRRREKTPGQRSSVPVAQSLKHVQADEHTGDEVVSAWGEPESATGELADARDGEHPRGAGLNPRDERTVKRGEEIPFARGVEQERKAAVVGFLDEDFFNFFQISPENRPARFFLYMKEGTI